MPYIKQEDREYLAKGCCPRTAGELNYNITCWIIDDVKDSKSDVELKEKIKQHVESEIKDYLNGVIERKGGAPRYQDHNDVIGACAGAVMEYHRRVEHSNNIVGYAIGEAMAEYYTNIVAIYEDEKIKENGDVYPEVEDG